MDKTGRETLLVCTVGGSPQPIATALRLLQPAAVYFLVSDGRLGESSRSQVVSEEIDYDRAHGIRGPGLEFAPGCPPESAVTVLPIPADDPDRAYAMCRSHLAEARRRHPEHRLIADYTGGTKSMSAALLMAALGQQGVEVQFMLGERADLVQVKSGTERPQVMAADFVMAERDFAAAEQAVDAYDYAAARRSLDALRRHLQGVQARPPKAFRQRLDRALVWTGVMARWDAFSHAEAAQPVRKEAWLEVALQTSGHLTPLLDLAGRQKSRPNWEVCADLWLNALRRGERGRYDDAVARLYRLLEAAAQAQLWTRYRLESGRIPPDSLPQTMRSSVRREKDRKTGIEYVRLALNQTVELLHAYDADDPFVLAFAGGGNSESRLQGPGWLVKRNHSILAHGFISVDQKAWNEAMSWTETNLRPFFRHVGFDQLPRAIPPLNAAV